MNKKILLLIVISLLFNISVLAGDSEITQENIGYKFYTNDAPPYYYVSSYEGKNGDIFLDWDDNLYIVNSEGTFVFNPNGAMINQMNERMQVPLKTDNLGNIYITQQNKITKFSSKKELLSTFTIDEGAKLLQIDDKNNYYVLSNRKEFKTNEYNDEIKRLEEKEKEFTTLEEPQDNGELIIYDQRLADYKNERRDSHWQLAQLQFQYDDAWKRYQFETLATEQSKLKSQVDDLFNQIKTLQERLKFVDKDYDTLYEQRAGIINEKENQMVEKQKEKRNEYASLLEEKSALKKKMDEDLKMKYEVRVYTAERYLTNSFPVPLSHEGIPLYSCNIIVSDRNGNFYGSDGKNIYIYDWEGNLLASFGSFGNQPGNIKAVSQLCVDSIKNIYVNDPLNNRVAKFGQNRPVLSLSNKSK